MKYCLTMEQVRRIAIWFEAADDDDAEVQAKQIFHKTSSEDFDSGVEHRECALHNEDIDMLVFDWS